MITDQIFYRLFETSPDILFQMLGMPADLARDMASHYQYQALEFKETAHRCDGVYLPKEPGLTLYFVEVQFYPLKTVFADLLVKIFTYLKQHDPAQPFRGVILFASQSLQPKDQASYQPYLDSGHLRCFYLDQTPEPPNASLGLSIMLLIPQSEDEAPPSARRLIARVQAEITDEALREELIQLIETVILAKLPRLSREEIQAMLQIHDIRQSRVYQEAKEEGRQEGVQEGRREGELRGVAIAIAKMAAKRKTVEEIADIMDVTVEEVRRIIARTERD